MAKKSKQVYRESLKEKKPYESDDMGFQEKVNDEKRKLYRWMNPDAKATWLAKEYLKVRRERDQKQAELSEINVRLEAVQQVIGVQYREEEIESITVDGESIFTSFQPHPQVIDRVTYRAWCLADPDLSLKMQLPWPILSSIVKERLKAGEPEPPGVEIFSKPQVKLGKDND